MSADEQVLREALRARAEQVDAVDDFVLPSVGLARRRARRAAAASVTAAAFVVAGVAVATWAATAGPPTPQPVPATATSTPPEQTPAPTAVPSPSETPTPAPSRAATTEAAPSDVVPWAAGSTVHLGSSTVDVAAGETIRSFAPLASGGVVVATRPGYGGDDRWRIHDSDGDVLADLGSGGTVVTSRDGRMVATKPEDGPVTVRDERGRVLGSKTLPGRVVAVADGWVWATVFRGGSTGWEVATGEVRTVGAPLSAVSADGRRGAVATPLPDGGDMGCWQVVDLTRRSTPVLLERCGLDHNPEGFTPQQFSDDGRLLLGHDDVDGGFYSRLVAARVSDGHVVIGRSTHGEQADGWTWALAADGSTILFSRNVSEPRHPADRNDLARCTLELECTPVADRVRLEGGDVTLPWYVVGQPLLPAP